MSFFNQISYQDSAQLDAFGRLQTGHPYMLFHDMSEYGINTSKWETKFVNGSATFVANKCAVQLSTGGTASGNSAIRQQRYFNRYQPGCSQLLNATFVMGAAFTNCQANVGYFNANNGVFFQRNATTFNMVLRSFVSGSVVDTVVAQASWSGDKLNGTGASGKTLDVTKGNIFWMDMQFLGMGRVRCGFVIGGVPIICHTFDNANANTSVFMSTGCLPVRYEVLNTGVASGTLTMDTVCATVISNGTTRLSSSQNFCMGSGVTGVTASSSAYTPVISLRAKATGPNSVANRGQIVVIRVSMSNTGTNPVDFQVNLNPTLTGAAFAAYNAASSIAETDTSATVTSGGTMIYCDNLPASNQSKSTTDAVIEYEFPLVCTDLNAIQDILSVSARGIGGTSTVFASITWKELY